MNPCPATAQAATFAPAERYDIFASIHRALRLFMADTLGRLGRLDTYDPKETAAALDQLLALLGICRLHLDKENRHVHPAIEARHVCRTGRVAGEHVEHLEEIAALMLDAAALRAAPTPRRALSLYRHVALFIADNLQHMHVEETALNEALWAAYTDDEIAALEQCIVESIGPEERTTVLTWMTRALPPSERVSWLGGLQRHMPAEGFRKVMEVVRAALDDPTWTRAKAPR